jgi:hypothetical protein
MTADMGDDKLAIPYFQPHVYGSGAVHILALAPCKLGYEGAQLGQAL